MTRGTVLVILLIYGLTVAISEDDETTTCKASFEEGSKDCELENDDVHPPNPPNCTPYDPTLGSVLVRESMGRLGNQMFTYQMMLSMRLKFGYRPFLSRKSNEVLGPIFEHLDMEVAEEAICDFAWVAEKYRVEMRKQRLGNIKKIIDDYFGFDVPLVKDEQDRWSIPRDLFENSGLPFEQIVHKDSFDHLESLKIEKSQYPWEAFSNRTLLDLADPDLQKGKAFILYPEGYTYYGNESSFIVDAPDFIAHLDRSFTMRPRLVEAADKTLAGIIEQHEQRRKKEKEEKSPKKEEDEKKKKKKKKAKTYTFVGIHSRRTDHLSYEKEKGHIALKPSYFLQAMEIFRAGFKNTIFIFISDDIEWGKQILGARHRLDDLYFASESKPEDENFAIGHDLALMKMCNHSIVSHGTFSFWVSFLAGGATISPYHFPEYRVPSTNLTVFGKNPLKNRLPRLHPYF